MLAHHKAGLHLYSGRVITITGTYDNKNGDKVIRDVSDEAIGYAK